MVKADVKCDYYADLDLPITADADDIKKQFRILAKQYHPDRNPGREVEVVAKFQAVQAAHEVLCDPQQKLKYDADRARQDRMAPAAQAFYRNPPPPPAPTNFPPPPRRATTTGNRGAFTSSRGRGRPPPSSGAEKYTAFTRAGAQQQAQAEDEAVKAKFDAMRGFRSMRTGQPQPQGFPAPPPPPRPTSHPTAPRAQRSFEQFQNAPQPGFPGMSRTAGPRKPGGFAPNTPGGDEPMAARTSAYANYAQGQRPQASNPQSYFPDNDPNLPPHSPTAARREPATSPLRQTRSSSGLNENHARPQRPEFSRVSSRYATTGGEKTFVNGLSRSNSVRNSPVDRDWEDNADHGLHRPHSHHGASTRHRSVSPTEGLKDISSSESESSFDADPDNFASRGKAQPRLRRQKAGAGGFPFRHVAAEDPHLTTQFSATSHKHIHSPQDEYTARYEYPPPPPRNDHATERTVPEPHHSHSNGNPRVNGDNKHHARSSSSGAPKANPNMYGPFHSSPSTWSEDWGFSPSKLRKTGPSLNGLPSWAVPSSVLPRQSSSVRKPSLETVKEEVPGKLQDWLSHPNPRFNRDLLSKADRVSFNSFAGNHEANRPSYPHPGSQSVSQENINTTFSATDWDGKFNSGDEYFRPTESRERKSPSRTSRTRARSVGKGRMTSPQKGSASSEPIDLTGDGDAPKVPEVLVQTPGGHAEKSTEQAFRPGKFSAEEWAAKLKDQTWSIPNSELNNGRSRTPKRPSKSNAVRRPTVPAKLDSGPKGSGASSKPSMFDSETEADSNVNRTASTGSADAMDIDDSFSDTVPVTPPTDNEPADQDQPTPKNTYPTPSDVNLSNLANVAPFAPSSTGLKDLDDLFTTLPFESRPAQTIDLEKSNSNSSSRDLRLPKPPKTIDPPLEEPLDKLAYERYINDMNAYFYDWNVFNKKMVEHFRSRQAQVDVSMASHWISMTSDGPRPEELDGAKAGYATFMAWQEDDVKCRAWWDVANEKNRKCFEDLGKMRARMRKAASAGVS